MTAPVCTHVVVVVTREGSYCPECGTELIR